ncbi:hypothetical protein F444_02771 [Phytophthora nicotianae P1976]|uniref:Uncharacterized protein n=2 Tax=Phytophthora nicotianae TaxID=4792 RepID=A0A081AW93_PHYNI|nr:hypothetical protein F444_02771 [Phytophthora nicotianae P1976]
MLHKQLLQPKDEGFLAGPPPRRQHASDGALHPPGTLSCSSTTGRGVNGRARCLLYRGELKTSFQTTYYSPDCSNGDAKFYLCGKARRGGDKTCFQVWHEDFACGDKIPAHLGKRVVLRRAPKAVGDRKKTRWEILREDNGSAADEAES